LLAGGATPSPFAEAYNAELAALTTPGPVLLLLTGVSPASSAHRADIGALLSNSQGVGFASPPAQLPFSSDGSGAIHIALAPASFALKFVAPANDVQVPVVSISLDGALATGCGALVVSKMKLLVPSSASSLAFHGSTMGALMGSPTETYGNGSMAWPLELSGTAQRVYAPGLGTGDGGISP
jgi:hypothetical protein